MDTTSLRVTADMPERTGDAGQSHLVSSLGEELEAIKTIGRALESLDSGARRRAITLILNKYGLESRAESSQRSYQNSPTATSGLDAKTPVEFEDVGALFEAAQPTSGPERALIGAYWLQVTKSEDGFTSQPLNDALKNLGVGVKNIADTLESLKERKPALIRQLQKNGPNKQGRKVYKLTDAGVRVARQMIDRPKDTA